MNKKEIVKAFPTKRVFAVDGMAVTAEVWEEAQGFHRQQQKFHSLLLHGPGIVTGLDVIASDPADSSLYILPGIAVDSHGQSVVLPDPMAYDLGAAQGLLYLLLTYEESHPRATNDEEDGPHHVYAQYGIEAVSALPDRPHVELTRVLRRGRNAPILNAANPLHPGENEIDSRFRTKIGAEPQAPTRLAMCYAGGVGSRRHGRGVGFLARALRRVGQQVWVDDGVSLDSELDDYSLVYLVGEETFQLSRDEMNSLYAYLQSGGTLMVESCRQGTLDGDPPSDAAFFDLFASMGVELKELSSDHPLLLEPYLFTSPPPGFEIEASPQFLVGHGVIFSTFGYGCLWSGERRDTAASREEIRTAMEWGANIVAFAVGRRQAALGEGESA